MNTKLIKAYAANRHKTVGEAESEIINIIRNVAHGLATKYNFGYHTREDIEQEAFIIAMEALEGDTYDVSRPLENFLYVHLKRRLINNIRKHYYRGEPPCVCCDIVNPPAKPCKKWIDWHKRNLSKQNLMKPLDMSNVDDEHEVRMSSPGLVTDTAHINEILDKIDNNLPLELRADYLRMRAHVAIPKVRRQRVREAVLAIIGAGNRGK